MYGGGRRQKPYAKNDEETPYDRTVTSNSHYRSMMELIRDQVETTRDKGCIYLSPLRFDDPSRARLFDFYKIKRLSRLPLYMYTIQRL